VFDVSLPQGFGTQRLTPGFEKSKATDGAILVSDTSAVAAGGFTQNRVVAEPGCWRQELRASHGTAVCDPGQTRAMTNAPRAPGDGWHEAPPHGIGESFGRQTEHIA